MPEAERRTGEVDVLSFARPDPASFVEGHSCLGALDVAARKARRSSAFWYGRRSYSCCSNRLRELGLQVFQLFFGQENEAEFRKFSRESAPALIHMLSPQKERRAHPSIEPYIRQIVAFSAPKTYLIGNARRAFYLSISL